MPSRQPRKPSIGLNSCSACTRSAITSPATPSFSAISAWPLVVVRQELVQRRVEQCGSSPGGPSWPGRCPRSRPAGTAAAWPGPSCGPRPLSARIISRIASMWSKNMCSVRHRPMPSAPKATACGRLVGLVGVGADLELAVLVGPASSAWRTAGRPRDCSGFSVLSISTCTTSLGLVATWPAIHLAGEAVDADEVAFLERLAARR